MDYSTHYQTRQTPQREAVPGKSQVENSAGGYVFAIDDWKRLDRFLILGTEGGTYYSSARKLTVENAEAVRRCIAADGTRVVNRIVEISHEGRAPKNDPALFALAMCAGLGSPEIRTAALYALPRVARIGTHLFHFAQYIEGFRGWGRGLRGAIAAWYDSKSLEDVSYQAIKYQQRDGWSHRDLLRLAHPKPESEDRNALYRWIVKGEGTPTPVIEAFEQAKTAKKAQLIRLIADYNLPREAIPTEMLNDVDVWSALLPSMPLGAMIRNLGKMSSIGLLKPMSKESAHICKQLTNGDLLQRSRLHPLAILVALKTYGSGHGMRGSLSWNAVSSIVDALDEAFYLAFDNIEPAGKRTMLALDVSGSMDWCDIAGMPITPREASAVLALVTAKTEKNHMFVAFSHELVSVTISPRQRIDDVIHTVSNIPMGGTDCSLPILAAAQNGIDIDTFQVYTDNETWAGNIHPFQALQQYREKTGINAKLVTVGMTSTGFSIADPSDAGMLDVVGFDTATPNIISDFSRE